MNRIRIAIVISALAIMDCAACATQSAGDELTPTRIEHAIVVWDGRYHLVSISVVQGAGVTIFVVDGSHPSPSPGPLPPLPPGPSPPNPFPPTPTPPMPGKLATVVIIEESAERTPATAKMLVDEQLLMWRETRKLTWHLVDKDVVDSTGKQPSKLKAYLSLAKDKSLPQLILDSDTDGSNGVLYSGSLPVGADKLIEVLNGF